MTAKEKLPRLVDVYRPNNPLSRRQIPLVVDENLTLVMDVQGSGIISDNKILRGRELEEFERKWRVLSMTELDNALHINKDELMHVLNQNVPCVGCRRSVERLYIELQKYGHPTLDPLIVTGDGIITIKKDKQDSPVLGSIFHDHAARLDKLIENQPKRNKKSVRCLLHSLDSQRSRPLTPVWRDVWDCMKMDCKKDVCIIEASSLHTTLETYLRKHRFCAECRTKVLKAYTLLVEEPEPTKEKGYVSSLYAEIKRCLPDKHIHLQPKTDYITKLISRAEPELLGRFSRRERHAKTLEIAQEEVLTCLGICMYERLHRVYMRMREEECTCQVFAAVAVHTLSRSFETMVERTRGVSQLELLYEEFAREEQQKQLRREQKKIKRRRKKGKTMDPEEKENCNDCGAGDSPIDEYDKDDLNDGKGCSCDSPITVKSADSPTKQADGGGGCYGCEKLLSPAKSKRLTVQCNNNGSEALDPQHYADYVKAKTKDRSRCSTSNEMWPDEDCKCDGDAAKKPPSTCVCDPFVASTKDGGGSDHSHDCGYSSENNNGCFESGSSVSSLSTSPEGSELACSDSCCQHEQEYISSHCRLSYGGNGTQLSLQEMLEDHSEDDDNDCYITAEEVREFKNNSRQVYEQRRELRETLQKRFAQFCVNGPLQVPRLLVQTKYASN